MNYIQLLSKDDLIIALQNNLVCIPAERHIGIEYSDGFTPALPIIKSRLLSVAINESTDYVLAKVKTASLSISYLEIEEIFAFDSEAHNFFKRFNPQYKLERIAQEIGIEAIIEESSQRRISKILAAEFNVDADLPDKLTNLREDAYIKKLSEFKREAKLKANNVAFLNDAITIGMLVKDENDRMQNQYKDADDIAKATFEKLKTDHPQLENEQENDVAEIIKLLKQLIADKQHDSNSLITKLGALEKNYDLGISPLLVKYIYLYLKNIDTDGDNFFAIIFELFQQLDTICSEDAKVAYCLYLLSLPYKDIYKSYYQFKKNPPRNSVQPKESIADVISKLETTIITKIDTALESKFADLNAKLQEREALQQNNASEVISNLETTIITKIEKALEPKFTDLNAKLQDNKSPQKNNAVEDKSTSTDAAPAAAKPEATEVADKNTPTAQENQEPSAGNSLTNQKGSRRSRSKKGADNDTNGQEELNLNA